MPIPVKPRPDSNIRIACRWIFRQEIFNRYGRSSSMFTPNTRLMTMNQKELDRALAVLAFLAAAIVIAMIAGILMTHIAQDFFQSARPVDEKTNKMADNPNKKNKKHQKQKHKKKKNKNNSTNNVFLAVRCREVMDRWVS